MFGKKVAKKENEPLNDKPASLLSQNESILPLVITKSVLVGAELATAIDMPKGAAINSITMAHNDTDVVCFVEQKNHAVEAPSIEDLYRIGCITVIKNVIKLNGENTRVMIEGKARAYIKEIVNLTPVITAKVELITYDEATVTEKQKILYKMLTQKFISLLNVTGKYEEFYIAHLENKHPDEGVDYITANLPISYKDFYTILQSTDTTQRLTKTIEVISEMLNYSQLEVELETELAMNLSEDQKNRYLREKKDLINKELGYDDDEIVDEYRDKLKKLNLPKDTTTHIEKEIARFEITPPGSQEAAVIQSYLECIFDLPWNDSSTDSFDIQTARELLNKDHYGLEKVKDRIEEYLAVIKLTNSLKGPILCLVGPPGVGKTSVAKSIANATGRAFTRMSLGGVRDEAEIRGHRKTYVGAMPGRIIAGLRQTHTNNPVFLLDEVDKLASDYKGDPSSALLEVLDPEQNSTFTDTFTEVPFDLSNVMFITTANTTQTIPAPLLDRMEVIELSGYTPEEKLHISREHLIAKQLEANGVTEEDIEFSDEVINELINSYTRESGVRQLEREIASLCRKAAKAKLAGSEKTVVTVENLHTHLGAKIHTYDIYKDTSLVGVVNGLAWTSAGGDTLQIEAVSAKGTGKLELTGNLGDVMKESARTAIGYLKANSDEYGIDSTVWADRDIHIHVPEGAVPKDGPSAGVTISTALISTLSGRAVSQKTAMTGEVTLTGRVLPIGGLKEKLLAASRAQVLNVIIPKDNEKDLEEIPETIKSKLNIHYAQSVKDVYNIVF